MSGTIMEGVESGGGVNPHVILKSFMLYLLEHCREVFVGLLGPNPCFESAWNVAFDFLQIVRHCSWSSRCGLPESGNGGGRAEVVGEDFCGTAARQIAYHPNHLCFQQHYLPSDLQTSGDLLDPSICKDAGATRLVQQVHGQQKRKRHVREQVDGQNYWRDFASWRHG